MNCKSCGRSISNNDSYCRYCGFETPKEFVPATSNKRLLNYLIDMGGAMVFAFCIGFVLAILGLADFVDGSEQVLGYLAFFLYYLLFESLTGKTPGKLLTNTRAVDAEGNSPEFRKIFIRSLVRFIPFEPFSFFSSKGEDGKHRPIGWHDKWSGTLVVDN